ncbi:hypothetical protein BLNAU_6277 [Blattamonas nauphoetae]|uniref:DNA2/NAM7 helicase helicase domain-containing protein n=1 Tax=Blattamonas nauphoetae TaxID=2049346 RepID=A0ABQ9Y4Y7_9EUKA|nr:hypothetical protein BLNAU_6277 [Blattamonas nauphoetae]
MTKRTTLRLRILTTEGEHLRAVSMIQPATVKDLYIALAKTLKTSWYYLTLMFPSILPQEANVPQPDPGDPKPEIVTAHPSDKDGTRWKSLVGNSGCKYTVDVMMDDLLRCWPVLDSGTDMAPITVIHLKDDSIPQPEVTDDTIEDSLKPLDMMFRLYYTKPEQRCIKLPVAEKLLGTTRPVYIRDCWNVFVKGVIKKFSKHSNFTPPTQPPNKDFPLLPEDREPRDELTQAEINAVPPELLASILQSPSWTEDTKFMVSFETTFTQDFDTINTPEEESEEESDEESDEDKPNINTQNVFINGQPGTGKSQMLVYLIYRLMHSLKKVIILYTPFQLTKVVTILIDHDNQSTPINVRVHSSSVNEKLFIRAGVPVIRIVDSEDPFKDLKMSKFFTVFAASPKIHTSLASAMGKTGPRIDLQYPHWRKDEFLTMMVRLRKTNPRFWHRPISALDFCKMHPLVVTLLGAYGQYIPNPAGRQQAYVRMNVIDVFGLTPRMLGDRVENAFCDLVKTLSIDSFMTDEKASVPTISHLTFKGLSKYPISSFAARLFTMIQKLKPAAFLAFLQDPHLNAAFNGLLLEAKVNQELLISHAKFTVFATISDRFQTFTYQLPQIGHHPTTAAELLSQGPNAITIQSEVLYSETLYDVRNNQKRKPWTGIDSFIYLKEQIITGKKKKTARVFHNLFTFQITISKEHKLCGNVLINAIRDKIVREQEINQNDLNVFFIWIVPPKYVESYRNLEQPPEFHYNTRAQGKPVHKTPMNHYTGVISVSDLLLNEYSDPKGIKDVDILQNRPMTQFEPESDAFIECFNALTITPQPNPELSITSKGAPTVSRIFTE